LIGLLGNLDHILTKIYLYVIVLVKEFENMTIFTISIWEHI